MSSSKPGSNKSEKRNLPSWMNPKDNPKKKSREISTKNGEVGSEASSSNFAKLLEGVVFVLSGFVNPERGSLRSQAMEMGAEYQSDWNSDCTLLICAFPNTPKFRQVETDCGTIVSKEWISECYNQKKLVEIERFLMHAGKPWRKSRNVSHVARPDQENSPPGKSNMKVERKPHPKLIGSLGSKNEALATNKMYLSLSEVQDWAIYDLDNTISWLQNQEETPEPYELKKIATEGILTCLQDAIETLEENKDIHHVTEGWKFVPRVVEELAKLENGKGSRRSPSRKELLQQAIACKRIYEKKFQYLEKNPATNKKLKTEVNDDDDEDKAEIMTDDEGFDSDKTIEMSEEEINRAFERVKARHGNC